MFNCLERYNYIFTFPHWIISARTTTTTTTTAAAAGVQQWLDVGRRQTHYFLSRLTSMPSLIHAGNYQDWCCVTIIILMGALMGTRTTVPVQFLNHYILLLFPLVHIHKKRCTVSSHSIFNKNVFINANMPPLAAKIHLCAVKS